MKKTVLMIAAAALVLSAQCIAADKWKSFTLPWPKESKCELKSISFNKKGAYGFVGTVGGNLWKTSNNGANWFFKKGVCPGDILSIGFSDTSQGWFSTSDGEIYATTDGGSEWTRVFKRKETGSIWKVIPVPGGDAYFTGSQGFIGKKTGEKYADITSPDNASGLYAGYFFDKNTGYLAGRNATVLFTKDGGIKWEAVENINKRKDFYGISFANERLAYLLGDGNYLAEMVRDENGVVTDSSKKSLDRDESLSSVMFRGYTGEGWLFADSGLVMHTADGGRSWAEWATGIKDNIIDGCVTDEGDIWVLTSTSILRSNNNSFGISALPAMLSSDPKDAGRTVNIYARADKSMEYDKWTAKITSLVSGVVVRKFEGTGNLAVKWDGNDDAGKKIMAGAYSCAISPNCKNGDVFTATANVQVDAQPPDEKTLILNLATINYKFGQVYLDRGTVTKLKEAASTFMKHAGSKLQVRGFAIKSGTATQSQCVDLSIDRAKLVTDVLVKEGVPATQIEMIGYGNEIFGQGPTADVVEVWLFAGSN